MNKIISSHQLTKCASVFVNTDNILFVINCLLCNDKFYKWPEFINHINRNHLQKENQKDCSKKTSCTNQSLDDTTDDQYMEEYLMESEDDNDCKEIDKKSQLDCSKDENASNLSKPINNCFFRINTTDSNIMITFIAFLRQHPCQWDHKHPHYTNKEKRTESTLHLAKQLKFHLKLNITPQGTRASVLCLIRWFDQEYLRLLRCEKNDSQFICTHSEYFEKLLHFLPHKHLQPMTCNECNKHFKSEHLLMSHKHKYHNGQVPFKCRYCGRGFIHQSSHKVHENRHIKIQLWPCKVCLYQATSKADHSKHLATHSSEQPFKCNICGLNYKTTSNLNVHKKSHGLPQYECEICKKKFYEKYRYKRHIWLHEKDEKKSKISIDNFTCFICGRRFVSNKTLMKHKLVHIEENYDLSDLNQDSHKKVKKDMIVLYYCNYCLLEFINKDAYKTHMNIKHNVE